VDKNTRAISVITSEKEKAPTISAMEDSGMVSGEETNKTDSDLTWLPMDKQSKESGSRE